MSFLQIIPEPGQLLLLGVAFILTGILFRKVRKTVPAVEKALPAPLPEMRHSRASKTPVSSAGRSPLVPMSAQMDSRAALVQE